MGTGDGGWGRDEVLEAGRICRTVKNSTRVPFYIICALSIELSIIFHPGYESPKIRCATVNDLSFDFFNACIGINSIFNLGSVFKFSFTFTFCNILTMSSSRNTQEAAYSPYG